MQAINITAFTKDSAQINAIKSMLKAFKIKYEIGTYNPDFVEKIKKSKQEAKEGKVTRVKKEDLQNFLGI